MTALRRGLNRFRTCERGVAAIEFGLLAPLLLLTLAVSIELGRMYQAHRSFHNAVNGFARSLASYPEYDAKVRTAAPAIGAALLPPDGLSRFHLQVTSLMRVEGTMQQVFTHTLVGKKPELGVSKALKAENFEQGEAVIQISAAYDYVPFFTILPGTRFTGTVAVTPYFSRTYAWNAGTSEDKFVR